MKIAIVCPDASRNPLVRTYPIARVLQRRHRLQVLGFRSGAQIFAPYRDAFDYDTVVLRAAPAFLSQAWELAGRIDADAVYAFKPLASSLCVGLFARLRRRIPLFLDVEDDELGGFFDGGWRDVLHHLVHVERAHGLLSTALARPLARLADEVFVVSSALQRRYGGTRLVHGADTRVFDPRRFERGAVLRRLGLEDNPYIVFTGTPNASKGLDELLAAVARVDRGARVLIVGAFHDDAQRRALEARHGARLLCLGPRPHDEMPEFLALADVVALPQRVTRTTRAQVPGKVFEAMAMARPILATAVSDLPEILADCGRVVAPGSADALAEGLEALLARPDEAAALGQAARARCLESYSWDAMERVLDERLARWETRA